MAEYDPMFEGFGGASDFPRRRSRARRRRLSAKQGAAVGGASVLLSATTVLDNATVNTVIGTLSVVGGTGSYTYTLTSNPGALFNISGSSLRVNAALTVGLKPITVQANNGAGGIINQVFNINVLSSAAYALKFDLTLTNNEFLLAL